jgi:hypothetical protein
MPAIDLNSSPKSKLKIEGGREVDRFDLRVGVGAGLELERGEPGDVHHAWATA